MKHELNPMTWIVKNFDFNKQIIQDYDILKYKEAFIKTLKKKCKTKKEFADALKRELKYYFWSRSEWELIIEVTEDNRIFLNPWVGCKDPNKVKIDVTNDKNFDWQGFSQLHINNQIYQNKAKIDVWDQIEYNWNEFINYCWEYNHKYQKKRYGGS